MRMNDKRGVALIPFALLVIMVVVVAGAVLFRVNNSFKRRAEAVMSAEKAVYLAEEGLACAYTELRRAHLDWFTHTISADGTLTKKAVSPRSGMRGRRFNQDGDYLPIIPACNQGDCEVKVRVYKGPKGNIWGVAKATYKGVTRVVRASLMAGNLLEFFHFYTTDHTFGRGYEADGRGFGKIYVNGNIKFEGRATFRNIALLSTNSTGHIYLKTWNKKPPYYYDTHGDLNHYDHIDGWAFLPMRNNEFFPGIRFNRDRYYGIKAYVPREGERSYSYDDIRVVDPVRYFEERPKNASEGPKFIFNKDVMAGTLNVPDAWDGKDIYMPRFVEYDNGKPVNYKFDIYSGEDKDKVDEKPVRFVRLYKKITDPDGNERWIITPDVASADYAQVFDGKDTTEETTEITIKYKEGDEWKERSIPLKEDGVTITAYEVEYRTICDETGRNCYREIARVIPHSKTYDADNELEWWRAKYPKAFNEDGTFKEETFEQKNIKDYIENGFTRKDAKYTEFGYPEYDGFNALNTGYYEHAERFKDWLKGEYNSSNAPENVKHKGFDLSDIIKEGSTGAVTLDPINIQSTLESQAEEGGIWIGYTTSRRSRGRNRRQEHLVVKVNGRVVYEEGVDEEFPDWLKEEKQVILGNALKYNGWGRNTRYGYEKKTADLLTIDLQKIPKAVLDSTNGVIWVNYRKSNERNDFNKALRLVHGERINREGGITVVTPQSVMIQGDFNYQHGAEVQHTEPCAIVTDSDVYILSKDFQAPDSPPAFADVVQPYRNVYDYLKDKLGKDYWPNPDVDCVEGTTFIGSDACVAKMREKVQKIEDVLLEFYTEELPEDVHKYGAPPTDKLKTLAESLNINVKEKGQILAYLRKWFYEGHHPRHPEEGLAPAMVMVEDDPDNRDVRINAAIVSGEHRGDDIHYIENWAWGNEEYANPASLRIEGMFPHVMNKDDKSVPTDRWSKFYSTYGFGGSIKPGPNPRYVAHDYSEEAPPGDFSYVGLAAYYIENDPEMFNRHPL